MNSRNQHVWRSILVAQPFKPVVIKPPEVGSAHDFALIGWILLTIMAIPWIIIGGFAVAFGVAIYLGYPIAWIVIALSGLPIIGPWVAFLALLDYWTLWALGGGLLFVTFLLVALVYVQTVRRINVGRYEGARASSLFFGVILLIPGLFGIIYPLLLTALITVIPALFFLLAYGKLGEVVARYGPVAVLSEALPVEALPGVPAVPVMGGPGVPVVGGVPGAPAVGVPAQGPIPGPVAPPGPPVPGVIPRAPLCPTCGRELFYASKYRRWYCQTCESRR